MKRDACPSVYLLRINGSDKFYIGSSSHPNERMRGHRHRLVSGRNPCGGLQEEFSRLSASADDLIFEVLASFDSVERSLDFEQWLLDGVHGSPDCLNRSKSSRSPGLGRNVSDAERSAAMARAAGRTKTDSCKRATAQANSKPVSCFGYDFPSQKAAAVWFSVSRQKVDRWLESPKETRCYRISV